MHTYCPGGIQFFFLMSRLMMTLFCLMTPQDTFALSLSFPPITSFCLLKDEGGFEDEGVYLSVQHVSDYIQLFRHLH